MTPLSPNNAILKTMAPIFFCVMGVIVAFTVGGEHAILSALLPIVSIALASVIIYNKYVFSFDVYFNDKELILVNFLRKRIIGLDQIEEIKRKGSSLRVLGMRFQMYKVDFRNESGGVESATMYISNMNDELGDFKEAVNSQNPEAKIENYKSRIPPPN